MNLSKYLFYLIVFSFVSLQTFAQNATVKGFLRNQANETIQDVSISYQKTTVLSDANGYYEINLPAEQEINLVFSHIGYESVVKPLTLNDSEIRTLDVRLKAITMKIVDLVEDVDRESTLIKIDATQIGSLPGSSGNFEDLLKTFVSVSSTNELSSQYSVRGGNFDENLVYVNDIAIYRPFLVRSGQQEGLSFTNADMVADVKFSAGGFEARYGDKLSSVLDIQYRVPDSTRTSVTLSLLGASATTEGSSKNNRLRYITGLRHRSNQFLLNSLDTEGDYRPQFTDAQTFLTYFFNDELELSFLGNYSRNQYQSIPTTRTSQFGTVSEALQLRVFFEGQEVDEYETGMGALRLHYESKTEDDKILSLALTASGFQTVEQEFFDVEGQYILGQLDNSLGSESFGEVVATRGVGSYLNYARNELFAQVATLEHRGNIKVPGKNKLEWGVKFQHEHIDDRLNEWQLIDSLGFSIAPPDQGDVFELYEVVKADNTLNSQRYSGFVQYNSGKELADSSRVDYTIGIRSNYWSLNKENIISPRATIAYQPNWKKDYLFRLSSGLYQQPPFYRELRDKKGSLFPNVKAQKSAHIVLGADRIFSAWGRQFKMVGELYYKYMWDVIPYEIENVRIRYLPEQKAIAYSAGAEFRINGEFVEGVESWIGIAVQQTQEDIEGDGHGYIAKPTDQRVNFNMFFQDYLRNNPRYKMHLNLAYGTGLPFGAPGSERNEQILRVPDYRRVDIGFSYDLKDKNYPNKSKLLKPFDSVWIGAEVFNLLAIRNTISYLWVTDAQNAQYAVPNYLTSRLLNFRLIAKF